MTLLGALLLLYMLPQVLLGNACGGATSAGLLERAWRSSPLLLHHCLSMSSVNVAGEDKASIASATVNGSWPSFPGPLANSSLRNLTFWMKLTRNYLAPLMVLSIEVLFFSKGHFTCGP